MPFSKEETDDVVSTDESIKKDIDPNEDNLKKCGYYYESDEYVPYGVKSFAELEAWQAGRDRASDVQKTANQFVSMMGNIVYDNLDGDVDTNGMNALFSEYQDVLANAANEEKSIIQKSKKFLGIKSKPDTSERPSLFIWKSKERDAIQWMTVYSNNFLDDDRPQNIITKDSHMRFVDMVDKEVFPLPELWLYHIPQYKFGEAEWVAYDDNGFALAGGIIDNNPAAINLAKEISMLDPSMIRVSHSMPKTSVKYDGSDERSIVEHQTIEISPLPDFVAATQLTGFVLDKSKEADDMAIDKKKRDILENQWGISPTTLDAVEEANKLMKQGAETVGLESKEIAEEVVEEIVAVVAEPEAAKDEPEIEEVAKEITEEVTKETDITREEIAEGINSAIAPINEFLTKQSELLQSLVDSVDGLKATETEKIEKTLGETPVASIASLIQGFSAIGNSATQIDGRTTLAKSMPEQTQPEDTTVGKTGINFLDNLISSSNLPQEAV